MKPTDLPASEKTGEKFDPSLLQKVQEETREAAREIASGIRPGMTEEAGYQLAKSILASRGFEKSWHRPYVRFGPNTTLIYGKPSRPDVVLGQNDLFFLDLGPVKHGHEGDFGETWAVGRDPEHERIVRDSKEVFHEVSAFWRATRATGSALYEFAERAAKERGWVLNPDWAGHRVSEFPHHAHFKGGMSTIDFSPSSGLWVLEIHLNHPDGLYGAFFEDLLET